MDSRAPAAGTAVALVTRLALAPDVLREDVPGDSDPAELLAAMERPCLSGPAGGSPAWRAEG